MPPGLLAVSLSVVTSGGGSAVAGLGCKPRSPAVPASVTPPRNLRRLNRCVDSVMVCKFLNTAS